MSTATQKEFEGTETGKRIRKAVVIKQQENKESVRREWGLRSEDSFEKYARGK